MQIKYIVAVAVAISVPLISQCCFNNKELAAFGDRFGFSNAIISGLAFWVIVKSLEKQTDAIEKQAQAIALQKQDIDTNSKATTSMIEGQNVANQIAIRQLCLEYQQKTEALLPQDNRPIGSMKDASNFVYFAREWEVCQRFLNRSYDASRENDWISKLGADIKRLVDESLAPGNGKWEQAESIAIELAERYAERLDEKNEEKVRTQFAKLKTKQGLTYDSTIRIIITCLGETYVACIKDDIVVRHSQSLEPN